MAAPDPHLTAALHAALPGGLRPFRTPGPEEILRVPATAPEVGEIVVRNDGDELTVYVGHIDHRHFEVPCATGATEQDRQREVAADVAGWIQDILAERVRFRVEFEAGRLVGCSSRHTEDHDGGRRLTRTDQVREYTWSGEKLRDGPAGG